LGKATTSEKLNYLEIAELQTIVANRALQKRWHQSYLSKGCFSESFEGLGPSVVEELSEMIAKGDCLEASHSV